MSPPLATPSQLEAHMEAVVVASMFGVIIRNVLAVVPLPVLAIIHTLLLQQVLTGLVVLLATTSAQQTGDYLHQQN